MNIELPGTAIRMLIVGMLLVGSSTLRADEPTANTRLVEAFQFHLQAQQRTGVLIPLYVYPSEAQTNAAFNEVIRIKRTYPTVPMWVIVNPASGPGTHADPNYTRAIQRLHGAGCMTLGYVTTSYAKRSAAEVQRDIDTWRGLYPQTHGIFFDEMAYEDKAELAEYQSRLSQYAHSLGCWPTVGNPGAETPGRYFDKKAADVVIIHEGNAWPEESRLKGDYVGGYADHPSFKRGLLLHSQKTLDIEKLRMATQYVRWLYITEAPYRPNDPQAANPWNRISQHLEATCRELAR